MDLTESRRLTGPNLITGAQGAVIDVTFAEAERHCIESTWRRFAKELLSALSLDAEDLHVRNFRGGASFVIGGPIDILYAICEINEWAWAQTAAELADTDTETCTDAIARFTDLIEAERNPSLVDLQAAALAHSTGFLWDDDECSIGYGATSQTWPTGEEPKIDSIDWTQVDNAPILMVTGTNGKTTTVRMLAAIITAWGKTPGFSSTDGLMVGDELIDSGDFSGPGGARTVLRDQRTEIAILETARGGMLRRGLGIHRADASAAAILNVAEDHMGEYGIQNIDDLVEAKFVIRKALAPDRPIVLNADDSRVLHGAMRYIEGPITWFTLHPSNPIVQSHIKHGRTACVYEEDALVLVRNTNKTVVTTIDRVPAAFNGHARYNISNALAAIGLATALDIPTEAMADGLAAFASDTANNPGRGNLFEVDGATAIVDFSHNPHGMQAFLEMANAMPARRRLLTLGQAGDRSDDAIRSLVGVVWAARPDLIVLKELSKYLRGREPGAILEVMREEFLRLGAPAESIVCMAGEIEATRFALSWAEPGDLLLLSTQEERDEVIAMLEGS